MSTPPRTCAPMKLSPTVTANFATFSPTKSGKDMAIPLTYGFPVAVASTAPRVYVPNPSFPVRESFY